MLLGSYFIVLLGQGKMLKVQATKQLGGMHFVLEQNVLVLGAVCLTLGKCSLY